MQNIEDFLAHFKGVKKAGNNQWMALCPAHDDEKPSLSIGLNGNKVLIDCKAGCSADAILRAAGLRKSDLFLGSGKPDRKRIESITTPATAYIYHDEEGNELFKKTRRGDKGFALMRKSGEGWAAGLDGVQRPLPLYRLPELVKADKGETVFVAEGEKDVLTLAGWDLTATCNFDGAGANKWKAGYNRYFVERDVVILADNDDVGKHHADNIADALATVARRIRLIAFDGPQGYDVTDWAHDGHSKTNLLELVETIEPLYERHSSIITAAALMQLDLPEPSWVIPGIVPEGVSLLAGAPKIGKSWLCLNLGIALASEQGRALGKIEVEQGEVLYLALEDNRRRLQKRMSTLLQGDKAPAGLHLATEWPRLGEGGLEAIESFLDEHPKVRLTVIDTLARIRPHDTSRSVYQVDYNALRPLQRLTSERDGLGVVVIHHVRKMRSDDPLELVSGSTGLTGSADSVLVLTRSRGRADGELFVTGRDVEEQSLALSWDGELAHWTILGDAQEYRVSKQRQEIIELLRSSNTPLTPIQIARALDRKPGNVRKNLYDMLRANELYKLEGGTYISGNSGITGNSSNTGNSGNG